MTSPNYLKNLNIVSLAMMAGLAIFAVIIYFLVEEDGGVLLGDPEMVELFSLLVPAVAFVALAGSQLLFKKGMESAAEKTDLKEKLDTYSQAAILRMAALEGPGLFAVIAYFMVATPWFLLIPVGIIALMALYRPTLDRVSNELRLNAEDRKLLAEY